MTDQTKTQYFLRLQIEKITSPDGGRQVVIGADFGGFTVAGVAEGPLMEAILSAIHGPLEEVNSAIVQALEGLAGQASPDDVA